MAGGFLDLFQRIGQLFIARGGLYQLAGLSRQRGQLIGAIPAGCCKAPQGVQFTDGARLTQSLDLLFDRTKFALSPRGLLS